MDKTSIEDVAALAGVSRRTIYREFKSKDDLFASLFELHVFDTTYYKALKRTIGRDFEHALLEGTLAGINLIRHDPWTMEIMYRSGGPWFQRQMLDARSPMFCAVKRIQMSFWGDILDRARHDGRDAAALNGPPGEETWGQRSRRPERTFWSGRAA